MKDQTILQKGSRWLLYLLTASIALEKRAVPYLISLFVITILLQKGTYKRLGAINNRFTIASISFYVLLLIGMIHTDNSSSGWFDLEVKFSLFLFPIILPLHEIDKKTFHKVLLSFVVGCFIAFLICLSMATMYYFSSLDPSVFYYNKLSVFHHPTYFSMYLNFSIVIFYYVLITSNKEFLIRSDFLLILMISVFSVFVVLLSSKMGLITLLVIIFGGTVLWFLKSRAVFPSILVFLMVSSMIYISFNYSNIIQERINEAVQSISEEDYSFSTTSARLAIWEVALDIIEESPIYGYGTGDVKDELLKEYKEREYNFLFYKKLNCHNQYLQSAIAFGVIGLIIFLFSIFYPLRKILQWRNYLYGGLLFVVVVNFLTESVLETQAGVVFYALFNSFLYFNHRNINRI